MRPRITRRQALAAAGLTGLGAVIAACGGGGGERAAGTTASGAAAGGPSAAGGTAPTGSDAGLFDDAAACTLTPEQTEGPFHLDVDAIRSDIREDREGAPLRLLVRVQDADGCTPVADAVVEIWHCDAEGVPGFKGSLQHRFDGSERRRSRPAVNGCRGSGGVRGRPARPHKRWTAGLDGPAGPVMVDLVARAGARGGSARGGSGRRRPPGEVQPGVAVAGPC